MTNRSQIKPAEKLSFPKNITQSAFKNKRLNITIYQPTTFETIEKKAKEIESQVADASKKAATSVIKGNFTNSVKALTSPLNDVMKFNGKKMLDILLPLPNNMKDSQTHEFNTDTGVVKTLVDKIPGISSVQKAVSLAANATHQSTIIPNPGYFQNYTGSTPRSFTFEFKLIPNNVDEAEEIINIINTIKKYSSPELAYNAFLIAPCFFLMSFSSTYLQNLIQPRPCIINSIETNYSGNGYFDTVLDGNPKYVTLSISITEIRALTREDWV